MIRVRFNFCTVHYYDVEGLRDALRFLLSGTMVLILVYNQTVHLLDVSKAALPIGFAKHLFLSRFLQSILYIELFVAPLFKAYFQSIF